MRELSIYEALPYLERDWEGISRSRASVFAQIEKWYHSRLRNVSGPVCELACGYGRLLVGLARSGLEVHGTDAALSRLNAAREHFMNEGLENAHFHHCRMPCVPQGVRFGAVILATNAIGYVHSDSDKRALLSNIASMLDDGGLLLMDHGRGASFLKLLRYWPGLRGDVGRKQASMRSSLSWCNTRDGVLETFVLRGGNRGPQVFCDIFRFDRAGKTLNRLRQAGFQIVESCGSYSGSPLRPWSRMIAVVARLERRDVVGT